MKKYSTLGILEVTRTFKTTKMFGDFLVGKYITNEIQFFTQLKKIILCGIGGARRCGIIDEHSILLDG